MFLVYERSINLYARSLDTIHTFAVQENQILDYYQSTIFAECDSNEDAVTRFNDIVEAAAEGQNVYDLRKDVGYWKPKKTATKKPGPKPKAEHSAPAEHSPAHKK